MVNIFVLRKLLDTLKILNLSVLIFSMLFVSKSDLAMSLVPKRLQKQPISKAYIF